MHMNHDFNVKAYSLPTFLAMLFWAMIYLDRLSVYDIALLCLVFAFV